MPRLVPLLVLLLAGCGTRVALPPPPTSVSAIAVAPVENKTGDKLVLSGASFVDRWLGLKKRTVPDAFRDALRDVLADRGFAVGDAGAMPTLRVTLRRFEPDLPQLAFVDVGVNAVLTDPDGTVRWDVDGARWLVSTQGAPSLAAAYDSAVRDAAKKLLDDWAPAP